MARLRQLFGNRFDFLSIPSCVEIGISAHLVKQDGIRRVQWVTPLARCVRIQAEIGLIVWGEIYKKKTIHSPNFLLHPVASDPIGKSGYFQSLKIGKIFIKWPNTLKPLFSYFLKTCCCLNHGVDHP
jgi:hypothetical protein